MKKLLGIVVLGLLLFSNANAEERENELNNVQSYLLAVRNCDYTQKEDSVGVSKFYRSKYGDKKIR